MRRLAYLIAAAAILVAAPVKMEILEGNPASPVRVLVFEDLQCSDCANLRKMLDEKVLPRYGGKVAFVHRDFPLSKHSWARPAAIAGRWVYEQNHEAGILFRQQILAEQANISDLAELKKWLLEFASRNKLNERGILDSLKDARLAGVVEQDFQVGVARGISKTPTVMVNGISIVELVIFDDLSRAIDSALAR